MIDERCLAHARSQCHLSPLGEAIGEAFLRAYLEGPPDRRSEYLGAFDRMLAAPEGPEAALVARREMRGYLGEMQGTPAQRHRSRAQKVGLQALLPHQDLMA
jgi:hypothetical protein